MKLRALLLVAGLTPTMPMAPTPPDQPLAQAMRDYNGLDPFMQDAVKQAVAQIIAVKNEMAKTHTTGCNITLIDKDFENGEFSEFFQVVCLLIANHFERHGYKVTCTTEKDVSTIHVKLVEVRL